MTEVDLGKVKMTDEEIKAILDLFLGGVRFGKNEEGQSGYYKQDEETGADTLIPFSLGGGGIEGIYDVEKFVSTSIASGSLAKTVTLTLEKEYKCAIGFFITLSTTNPNPTLILNDTVEGIQLVTATLSSYSMRMLLAIDASIAELKTNDEYNVNYTVNTTTLTAFRGIVLLIQ